MTLLIGHIHCTEGFIGWLVWKIIQADVMDKHFMDHLLSTSYEYKIFQ